MVAIEPGTVLAIANVVKQAFNIINAMTAAPAEFATTVEKVRGMKFYLEGLRTDIIDNPGSVLNRQHASRATKQSELNYYVKNCEKSLGKVQTLINKYNSMDHGLFRRWRWADKGKQEVNDIEVTLMTWTTMISGFMQRQGLSSLPHLEITVEKMSAALIELNRQLAFGNFGNESQALKAKSASDGNKMKPNRSKIPSGVAFWVTLAACRLKSRIKKKRKLQRPAKTKCKEKPKKRPTFNRVNTSPESIKRTATLLREYADDLSNKGHGWSISPQQQPRLECWMIRKDQYAFGGCPKHKAMNIKRGQAQLAEMVALFQAGAEAFSSRRVDSRHSAVKFILGRQEGWSLAAARINERGSSPHGLVRAEKVWVTLEKP